MLHGVIVFFTYTWWWLNCMMTKLLNFFFPHCAFHPALWLLSLTAPFFKETALSASSQSSVTFCSCLPIVSWFSSSSTTGLWKHKIFSFFQKPNSDLYPRWAIQKAFEHWNVVWVLELYWVTRAEISWSSGAVCCGVSAKDILWTKLLKEIFFLIDKRNGWVSSV